MVPAATLVALHTKCRSAIMKGRGKWETPEKTHQPTASSGMIPTCENLGVTRSATEPGSPWWEASILTHANVLRRRHALSTGEFAPS
ncbi:hypothetical protein PR048_033416 [Dryococelus australis]|uniref:Uncharacterized protein n=1 Tax=Dryococelus australis TaxID=614101 RepID=A0ABQ9G155_9NEOP|nr:hypothetical protein PR048_033416 [Dryococelus australis]